MIRLFRGRHVLTFGAEGDLVDGAVAVTDDRITAVGPWTELQARHPDAEVIGDGRGILTPGLINCHGHFSEALITGLGDRLTLWEWIAELIGPVAPHLTAEMAEIGTLLRGAEMALSGVTTVNDMFVSAPSPGRAVTPGIVAGLDRLGLRGEIAFGAQNLRGERPLTDYLDEHHALVDAVSGSAHCRFRVGIANVLSQSPELFAASVRLAREHGRVHIHFHEVREEVTACRVDTGRTPIGHAASQGLLEADVLAAHCVWLDDDDVAALARNGVGVSHNPVANMILGSGVCPLPRLSREGIAVGIGTDGPASNDSQDMLEAVKSAALLQKVHHLQASVIDAREVLRMACVGGARALNLAGEVGTLEPGKAADLVLFDGDALSLTAVHDPYQSLVYCANGREVAEVWVAGAPVVRGGDVVTVDLDDVRGRARELAARLVQDAGVPSALVGDPEI